MKIARSISRFFVVMLVLGNYLLCCTPVFAQLTVGSNGLWVKDGAILSVDGLALNPTETIDLSTLQRSATPITYYGASSINQVYVFSTPITFSGTLLLYYDTAALGGIDPNTLKLAYAETIDGPLTMVDGTVLDAVNGVLEYEFDDPVTLQLISAMVLDLTPPTVSVTTSEPNPTMHSPITVSITFSLPVLGFTADDVTVSNGAVTAFSGTEATYTAEITPASDGQITIAISAAAAASLAGEANAAMDVPLTIEYDGTPPAIPSAPTLDPVSDTGLDDADGITNNTVPTFTGTAEAGSSVTLYDTDGTTVLGTATATGGNWSIVSSALSEGDHSMTATATDAAGNVSAASSALEINIDITAPAKPAIPDLAPASDSGESNSDNLTNLTNLTLQGAAGSAEAQAQIHARSSLDGGLTTSTANADGSWSLDVAALAADIHLLQVQATDVAGNTSGYSDPLTVKIDNTAPTVSSVAFDQARVTAANQTATGFSLIGAESSTKAEYTITSSNGGTAVMASELPVNSSTQQFTGIDVSGLNDGTLTLSLTLVDIAGNTSTAVTGSIDKDARLPTVTGVSIADGDYTESDVISITITLDEDVTVSGAGSTLTLDIGGDIRQAAFTSESMGVLLYRYTVQPGEHTGGTGVVVAADGIALNGDIIRDVHGNDAVLAFAQTGNAEARVDTEAPAVPVVVSPATAATVNAGEFTISGTHSENGVTVSLYLDADNDGVADNATVLDAAVIADGTWSLSAVLEANADNNFVVIAEDAVGNRSGAVAISTISEDSQPPAAPSQPDLLAGSDTGMSDSDNLTNSTTPTFTGKAEAYATVELFADTIGVGTTVADESGNWSITTDELSAGTHKLAATATDLAGNVSALSAALIIIIDNEAPTLTITGMGDNSGLYTGNVTVVFSKGTATLNGVPFTSGTVVTESDVYELVVTDAAGNVISANFTINNKPQEITFNVPAGLKYGDEPVELTGVATSGLPVVYMVTDREGNETNVATVENNKLYIHAAGELLVTAAQEGDTEYTAATPVGRPMVIGKAPLHVTASPQAKVYGTADPALTYIHSRLMGEDGAETFEGLLTRVSGEDVGNYTIARGTLSAGDNYEITFNGSELTITQADRALDFPPLPAKTYGDGDFNAGATVSRGEVVTYTSSDPSVVEVTAAGLLRVIGAGQATITATVAADVNYTTRPQASQTLVVRKAAQSITFNAPATVNRDAGSIQLDVTAGSGLPISLTIDDEQVATLSGTALNVLRLGTVRITATQPGDANLDAAEPVTVTVRVIDPSAELPVRIHSAISPNGDGINEFLMIEAIKDYPENRVHIFNRNGTVVWEASGYNNGTMAFRGIGTGQLKVAAGTYFYVAEIRVDGEWKFEKGWFVLRY